MPFKSKKQKKTIDAAAHNPTFAKKVGIKTSDAKKMSAHGKGQTKFDEDRTEVKDKDGKVTSWKDEGEWKKSTAKKDPRGKVTNMSDKARRETEKLSKAEKEMAESFEKALSEVKVTSGPNKGKQWSPKTPGPTNPNFKDDGSMGPSDGATAPPPGYKAPKSMKKAEVDTPTTVASTDSEEVTAGMKRKGKQVDEVLKGGQKKLDVNHNNKIDGDDLAKLRSGKKDKKVKEATEDKCNHTSKGKKCPVHGLKECGSMYEGSKVDQNNDGKNDFEDVKIARMKAAMKGKKKVKESTETQLLRIAKQAMDTVKALREARVEEARIKHMPISESDEYFTGLQARLNKQIKG